MSNNIRAIAQKIDASDVPRFVHEDGWLKSEDKMSVCLMCDFVSVERHDRTIKECPHCGFEMTDVEYFRFYVVDDRLLLVTDPN